MVNRPVEPSPEFIAAIDLGSNSFHMVIARLVDGEIQIVDRIKDMVRLADGLDKDNTLDVGSQARALATLDRFGERLRGFPEGTVRAVGTNTLRKAVNTRTFMKQAEAVLGHPIEVVAGKEEARLIYLGVANSIGPGGGRRLVMDIGGGSTEFIIGEGFEPLVRESKYMGCVSFSKRFFPDGNINKRAFEKAAIAAQQELRSSEKAYKDFGWETAVGSSGTVRAVHDVITANGIDKTITYKALKAVRQILLDAGHTSKLEGIKGLPVDRATVLPGGLAIMLGAFRSLQIKEMSVSDGALREGLLYDLVGRFTHVDIRDQTIRFMATKNQVDREHAQRVENTAVALLDQVAVDWDLTSARAEQFLRWTAQIHEIGLSVAHSRYHKHGSYLVEHSDMAGFSREDQKVLWAMIRSHRRSFKLHRFVDLHSPFDQVAPKLTVLLRLAVLFNRSRRDEAVPDVKIKVRDGNQIRLKFPPEFCTKRR
ncbi:MAG: exopolyphosphatase [bacterium]